MPKLINVNFRFHFLLTTLIIDRKFITFANRLNNHCYITFIIINFTIVIKEVSFIVFAIICHLILSYFIIIINSYENRKLDFDFNSAKFEAFIKD